MATCRRCLKEKPPGAFPRDRSRRSGRHPYCKDCRYLRAPQEAGYRLTIAGTAKTIRAHHPEMGVEDSLHWAAALRDPYTRCEICGLPERIRAAYKRAGWKTHPFGWRLSLDRIDPWKGYGDRSNLRVLCARCNGARGKAVYTDEEVLRKVRGWYRAVLTKEELWWLNETPGAGGSPTKGRQP